jgi:Holliday junction DNA helicase RuvA
VIGRLRGVLAEVAEEDALIDVGGVGYVVKAGAKTLARLPAVGDELVMHIESVTREDGTRLYGFLTRDERRAFVTLTGVQGVGPKAALAVLDVLPPSELATAIARDDKTAVARAQGVGARLAQRIVVELKDKAIGGGDVASVLAPPGLAVPAQPTAAGDAVAALMGLGVAEPVARRAVESAAARLGGDAETPALVKAALQELGR